MSQLTNEMLWLIDIFSHEHRKTAPKDVEKIKLSQLVSKLGFFYEKLRNAVDYNEEHLIKRNSIERFLRRQILFLAENRAVKISKALIYEFIRARYLPNDALPETFIAEVAQTVEKYLAIAAYIAANRLPKSRKLIDWVITMASCEINEQFNPAEKEMAVANLMYSHLVDSIVFTRGKIEEKERNLQIYIAVLKNLNRADPAALRYNLLKLYLPNWNRADEHDIKNFCQNLTIIKNKIDRHLAHPIGFQLSRVVRPQSVFFFILREIMDKNKGNLEAIFKNPDALEEKIEDVVTTNYQKVHGKLIGTIFRVIIYIFFTKTILAFILELPYDYFLLQHINWRALGINVVFHPVLMFFVAMTIRVPGARNTQIIVAETKKIVYGEERKIIFKQKSSLKRGSFGYFIFNGIYLIMFAISFGIVISVLRLLHFNILSGVLFVFFLTVVSFFGFRLRDLAKQLSVVPRRDNLINFLVDFVSIPIIRLGKFLSTNFAKVNIFLYFLDFVIETPLKMLIEFLENTVSFIRDKREEISE